MAALLISSFMRLMKWNIEQPTEPYCARWRTQYVIFHRYLCSAYSVYRRKCDNKILYALPCILKLATFILWMKERWRLAMAFVIVLRRINSLNTVVLLRWIIRHNTKSKAYTYVLVIRAFSLQCKHRLPTWAKNARLVAGRDWDMCETFTVTLKDSGAGSEK